MGSFAFTCAVSGLPIHPSEPVRFLMLTQNPYDEENLRCYAHSLWFPRCFPLRAKYNDYGSVEECEDGPLRQAWMDGLRLDLIERGWGANSCHDVSTSKDMSFDDLLTALWEGRVQVHREISFDELYPAQAEYRKKMREDLKAVGVDPGELFKENLEKHLSVGIPTLRRLSEVATQAGFEIFTGNHHPNALMIDDDHGFGCIRVRVGTFGERGDALERVEVAIRAAGYATVMTPGTGSYADSAELLVFPVPGTKGWGGGVSRNLSRAKPLAVCQAMIREDVWQSLLKVEVESDYEWDRLQFKEYKAAARAAWDLLKKTAKEEPMFESSLRTQAEGRVSLFFQDDVPLSVGLATAFRLVARHELSPEQIEDFIQGAAEFLFVSRVLSTTRYQWRPSFSNGPQYGDWGLHARVLAGFARVAENKQREEDRENAPPPRKKKPLTKKPVKKPAKKSVQKKVR